RSEWSTNGEWRRLDLTASSLRYEANLGQNVPVTPDTEYTESLLFRTDATSVDLLFSFFSPSTSHNYAATTVEKISGDLYRVVGTGVTGASQEIIRAVDLMIDGAQGGTYIEFKHGKLEKGNKATDWTPAPEDQ